VLISQLVLLQLAESSVWLLCQRVAYVGIFLVSHQWLCWPTTEVSCEWFGSDGFRVQFRYKSGPKFLDLLFLHAVTRVNPYWGKFKGLAY